MDMLESIEKLCKPTASQEEKFRNCPLARESEIFPDSKSDEFSSSPDLIPSETTAIVILSLPDSLPEHHLDSNLSQQNPNDLCAEQLTVAEAREATKVRVPEVGLDDEPEPKGIEVERREEFDEEAEIKGGEINVSGGGDSGGEANLDAAGDDIGKTPKNAKKRKHSRRNGGHKSVKTSENAEKPKKLPPSFEGREKENDMMPPSFEGREKENEVVESSEKKSGLLEVLDEVKALLGCKCNDGGVDSENENILETAKMMGVEFPIPRWWPSEDDDPQGVWY